MIRKLPKENRAQAAMDYQLFVQIDDALPVSGNKKGLKKLIAFQNSSGFWSEQDLVKLGKYFKNGSYQYQDLRTELQKLAARKKKYLVEDILTTIIALYLLEERYEESSDEWTLIATKAKAWLIEAGIDKPAKWLDKVTFTVKS